MFQVNEESLSRLIEASKTLHGRLVASPLWELVKQEGVIVDWVNALREVESQIKKANEAAL